MLSLYFYNHGGKRSAFENCYLSGPFISMFSWYILPMWLNMYAFPKVYPAYLIKVSARDTQFYLQCIHCFILLSVVKATQCRGPLALADGMVIPSEVCEYDVYIPFNTSCSYRCISGFLLIGPSYSVCLADGSWSTRNVSSNCEGKNLPAT